MRYRLRTLFILITLSAIAVGSALSYANWVSSCDVDSLTVERTNLPDCTVTRTGSTWTIETQKNADSQILTFEILTKARANNKRQSCTFATDIHVELRHTETGCEICEAFCEDGSFYQFAGLLMFPEIVESQSNPALKLRAVLVDRKANHMSEPSQPTTIHCRTLD